MKLRSFLALSILTAAAAGCAPAADDDEASQTEAAQTAQARARMNAFTGVWRVDTREGQSSLPDRVLIQVTDDAVDPTTGSTKGTRLRIMQADQPAVPAIDRAPFINVDEGKSCENVRMGGTQSLTVCHDTKLTSDGTKLTHTVSATEYTGYVIPTGWSSATQTLALEDGRLQYTYSIDGELVHDVMFARP